MGNVLADCQRCSINQCELCEVLPVQSSVAGSTSGTPSAGPRQVAGVDPEEYQPAGVSEADLIQQALRMSRLEAAGQRSLGPQATQVSNVVPRRPTDEEIAAQAAQRLKLEEEARERARLLEEQRAEYEESLRIDRQRAAEKALRQKEEEERLRREEEEAQARLHEEARRRAEAEAARQAEEERLEALVEEARQQLTPEPLEGEASRVQVLIRAPDGRRLKRAFRGSDRVGQVYHYVTVEGGKALAGSQFRLVTSMPRQVFEDRHATLEGAGLKGQCALLVEILDD